jgi:hypothetical protein
MFFGAFADWETKLVKIVYVLRVDLVHVSYFLEKIKPHLNLGWVYSRSTHGVEGCT